MRNFFRQTLVVVGFFILVLSSLLLAEKAAQNLQLQDFFQE